MHGQQACLFKYITVAEFHIYAVRSEDVTKRGGRRPCIKYFMEITSLIVENDGKIMEMCF